MPNFPEQNLKSPEVKSVLEPAPEAPEELIEQATKETQAELDSLRQTETKDPEIQKLLDQAKLLSKWEAVAFAVIIGKEPKESLKFDAERFFSLAQKTYRETH